MDVTPGHASFFVMPPQEIKVFSLSTSLTLYPENFGSLPFTWRVVGTPGTPLTGEIFVSGDAPPGLGGFEIANPNIVSEDQFDFNFVEGYFGLPFLWHGYNYVYCKATNEVPEPSTMLLIGSGLFGLWGFRKKFRK